MSQGHKWGPDYGQSDSGQILTRCLLCDAWIQFASPTCSGVRKHRWKDIPGAKTDRECLVCGMNEGVWKTRGGNEPCPGPG